MPFTLVISTHDEALYQMLKAMASASGKAHVCHHPAFNNPGFNVNPKRPACPIQGQQCMPAAWAQGKLTEKDAEIKKLKSRPPPTSQAPPAQIELKRHTILKQSTATATTLAIREYMVRNPSIDCFTFMATRKAPRKYTTTVIIVP